MNPEAKPKRGNRVRVIVLLVIAVAAGVYYTQQIIAANQPLTASGTLESTNIYLASQVGGQIKNVLPTAGDAVQAGQTLVTIYKEATRSNETITAPIDGVVLERLIEPGELAAPGRNLMVMANLDTLNLIVFVPEDHYGKIVLGQTYPVTVDSLPGQSFSGKVSHIAEQAEFTPRNVQTIDKRKTTMYAIKLDLDSVGGVLKPGMPATVNFDGL